MKRLLKNAKLHDGTGAEPSVGDVLIDGDRFAKRRIFLRKFL